ncbi:MAG: hypothetical protein P8O09_04220, partial [Flavobacteriaceae bacterium]|nr:hypothetical protein [Flavobacteriaceae bacterium]
MKKFIIFCFYILSISSIMSQEDFQNLPNSVIGFGNILLAGEDASLLAENYLRPSVKGLISGMNSGWYSTAKTHKKFGFDITFGLNSSLIPSKGKVFDFISSDYSYISVGDSNIELPTVLSDDDSETIFNVSIPVLSGDYKVGSFTLPGGIAKDLPVNAVPTPFIQLGLGLPYKIELNLRYVPDLNYDSKVNGSSVGVGIQHDLTQYLGLLDKLPYSISVMGAFSKANIEYAIDKNLSNQISVTDGNAIFNLDTWTVQALGSLNLRVFTIYAGVGYNYGTSNFNVNGDYTLSYRLQDSNQNSVGTIIENIS